MDKRVVRYILYSLLIVFLFFLTIEFTTRTISWLSGRGFSLFLDELEPYDPQVEGIYQWHPFVGYTFKPNTILAGGHPEQKEKALIYIDKNGFLVSNGVTHIDYKKKNNEIRIAFIGGSTTASLNLSFEENWPGYLGMLVQKRLPEKYIQVINAAVPGFHTAEDIGNLALRVMPFKPDIVIIKHSHNDLMAIIPNKIFKPDYSHMHDTPFAYYPKPNFMIRFLNKSMLYVRLRNLWRKHKVRMGIYSDWINVKKNMGLRISYIPDQVSEAFEQHMQTLISIAKGAGAKVILTSYPTLYDLSSAWSKKETFDNLSDLQKRDLSSILYYIPGLTLDGFFRGLDQYNSILKRLSEQENTGWVDSASLIPHEDKYFVDRIHLSKIGAQRMAESLLPVVLEMLEDK